MDVKKNGYNCYKNIKNEFDKKNNKKIIFSNLIKSTQKSNSRVSIFNKKQSSNKKEKSLNLKSKEMIPINKLIKKIPNKKDIIKEKQEKIKNISTLNETIKSKENITTDKNQNRLKNNNSKENINNIKKENKDNKKSVHNSEQKNLSSMKQSIQKDSIYDSPIINKNSDDDLVTSFEKKPSELKSPDTVSEDSFITDEDEINNNKSKQIINDEKYNNNICIGKKEKELNYEINEEELIEQDNEIIYVDKIKEFETEKESKEQKNEKKKEKNKIKNKDKNKVNNIKVNIKGSIFNDIDKNNLNKGLSSKLLNQSYKNINENNSSKETNSKCNKVKLNNKNNNSNSTKKIGADVPFIQKCITVKKNQVLNTNNIETKYNRNTSKNNQNEYLESIKKMQKNLSNKSSNFFSDKKIVNITKTKYKNKLSKIEKNKVNKNLSQTKDKCESIIFHKKLKIEQENTINEYQKINQKDISSSNNKNTNISSSINNTYKEDEVNNEKIIQGKIPLNNNKNNDSKKVEINKTSINKNIKLMLDNKDKANNKKDIYYLKKNSHLVNKINNKLALHIDDSNTLINNCKKMINNMSGNNIIYSRKNNIMTRVRSHEKAVGNVYNNMSYDPNRNKKIEQSDYNNKKYKEKNINLINNIFNRKGTDFDMLNFLEKNNSFSVETDNYGQNLLNNENGLNSLRLNSVNSIPRFYPINYGSFIESMRMGSKNNSLSYYNKTAEKPIGNNNLFMLNRLTTGDRINMDNFIQKANRSVNFGINLNTDYNNYNKNFFNINKSFVNEMNQYPIAYNLGMDMMTTPINNNINQTNLINLFNNNYLNFNTIQNKASSFINSYNVNDSLYYFPNNTQSISPSINIEDIIILQEKLKDIILALNKAKAMANECFEFWNFYFNCSIYSQLEKLFTNLIESNIVRISINYLLLSIMICYDYSFEKDIITKSYPHLLDLIKLNYNNLIMICEHILSVISSESKNNIWVQKLKIIVNSYKKTENIKINNTPPVDLINHNTNIIVQNLYIILKNFKTMRNEYLFSFMNDVHEKSYKQLNIFFREYILRTNNLNGSILASVFLRNNTIFNTLPAPYVRTKNNKKFSLVLDLDETLVHYKEKNDNEGGGVLRIRPGLNDFLDEVGKFYELILFTTATHDYADLLIDAIEEDKIYFDHRLYREHAVIIDNDFVKDLNRIGRPLDKIIIVDNMMQNFRLQKDNGIMIKAFWGEDNYDTALYDLIPILVNIAKEEDDVRKGLEKYKDEILKNISLNNSKEKS